MKVALASHEIKLFSELGTGTVEETINPKYPGRVKYKATFWPAQFYNQQEQVTLLPNESVTVVGRQGITLLVVSISKEEAESSGIASSSRSPKRMAFR